MINIAELLKDKPEGTKFYSLMYGEVNLCGVSSTNDIICAFDKYKREINFKSNGYYSSDYNNEGECLLFPSKEMRDWDKFSWKKGDILKKDANTFCIFESWGNSKYTEFNANYVTDRYSGGVLETKDWHKETNENIIKQYIDKIEEIKGGKLNLETLEIEKPKFKNEDIVVSKECEFEPFQKVLIRNNENLSWFPAFYVEYNECNNPHPYTIIGYTTCKYCIPYDDETKHLLGTTDEWKGGEE